MLNTPPKYNTSHSPNWPLNSLYYSFSAGLFYAIMQIQVKPIFLLLGVVCTVVCHPSDYLPTVTLKNGTIVGARSPTYNQEFFLGVPFASPPVGDLRLRKPVPPKSWNGIRVTNTYSDWCMGVDIGLPGFSQNVTGKMSEDCLYLNIVRPAHVPATAKLPVMAWIHSGAFLAGSANDLRYNGSFLVENSVKMETPVIFVSFNYRLGALGMLAGSEAEVDKPISTRPEAGSGLDTREHRKFWRRPVQGHHLSAGAISVGLHLIAYGSRDDGLFSAAIMESGNPYY